MPDTKKMWIIGIGGSEMDSVGLSRFFGTTEEVKNYLVGLVLEERDDENREDEYECGSETPDEITTQFDGTLYAYANFSYSHMDFVAKAEEDIPVESFEK